MEKLTGLKSSNSFLSVSFLYSVWRDIVWSFGKVLELPNKWILKWKLGHKLKFQVEFLTPADNICWWLHIGSSKAP